MANREGGYIVKHSVPVTPSDGTDITPRPDAVYAGGAGNVSVMWDNGAISTLPGLQAGGIYPISPRRIRATGTTATGIEAMYFDV